MRRINSNFFRYRQLGFGFNIPTWADHECSSALPLKERLRMWFLNCSISSGFCCWICCANCCPLTKRYEIILFTCWTAFYQNNSLDRARGETALFLIYNKITEIPPRWPPQTVDIYSADTKSDRRFSCWLSWTIITRGIVLWCEKATSIYKVITHTVSVLFLLFTE